MTREQERLRDVDAGQPQGPIKPGSPLYRVLQLIAREVARTLHKPQSQCGKPRSKH
jgi:hypothetical protein